MRKLRAIAIRLKGLLHSGAADHDFSAELESHIEMHVDEGIRKGLSPDEARRRALIQLGGTEQPRQAHRDRRSILWVEQFLQAVQALRTE